MTEHPEKKTPGDLTWSSTPGKPSQAATRRASRKGGGRIGRYVPGQSQRVPGSRRSHGEVTVAGPAREATFAPPGGVGHCKRYTCRNAARVSGKLSPARLTCELLNDPR